jgi:membrane protein implicated in regulation of membrane protease activity
VPGAILGALGGVALATGAALAIAGAGAGAAVVVAAVLAALGTAAVWLLVATRKSLVARRLKAASGREALSGRTGIVRSWNGEGGQVFVDGALWSARRSWPDDPEEISAGDAVVVERVSGLTLGVRRAEKWEVDW